MKCANMKERRMHHAATVINNKLYVTGGRFLNAHDVIEDSDCFECYDPKTDVWTSKGSLPYKLFDHGSLSLICVSNRPNPPWLLRGCNISAWASRSLPCSLREMKNMGPRLRLETIWGRLHWFVGWVYLSCGFDGMLLVLASICAVLIKRDLSWQLQVSQWTSGSEPRTSEQNGRLTQCTAVPEELRPTNL